MDVLAPFRQTGSPLSVNGSTTVRSPFRSRVLVLALALLAPFVVLAAPAAYTGEAPVESQSDEDRAAALKAALANVFVEQSGERDIVARGDVAKAVQQAERYVLQYQYRRGDTARYQLVAQFDSAAVDSILQRSGAGMPAGDEGVADAPSEATVWIGGINNADDYANVVAYLARNNFVRSAQPTYARGDGMLVRLSLTGGLARFLDAVGLERVLAVAAGAKVEGADAALALTR